MAETYEQKKRRVSDELKLINRERSEIALNKTTSNLFRDRKPGSQRRLNVRDFNEVIRVDPKTLTAEVEGMTTFEDFTVATLEHGLVPLVVPELKTITVGGAVSGLGIESSSFKYGLVHEGLLEMEVLLADGRVVTCRPTGEYRDLFYGLPNSYGTLGYVLKLTLKLRKAPRFVHLRYLKFDNPKELIKKMSEVCASQKYEGQPVDFVDGVAFNIDELYLVIARGTETAPYTSDYTYEKQFFRSIQQRKEDHLTIYDYLWRWDTDWFWCSKNVIGTSPLVRRVLGRERLGSKTYASLMRWEQTHHYVERFNELIGRNRPQEAVIQDIEVPAEKGEEFLREFDREIGIRPVWICPTKAATIPLYPMDPKKLYLNFGFWDSVPTTHDPASGYYNKKVEDLVERLGGMKSLYSTSYYDRERFERIYNYKAYKKLKKAYDPDGRLKDLYQKTVERA